MTRLEMRNMQKLAKDLVVGDLIKGASVFDERVFPPERVFSVQITESKVRVGMSTDDDSSSSIANYNHDVIFHIAEG